ncbi:MAG: rhamnulokinase [Anaerolineae bacterium]|nr:rhamnulokinase [Anaerolineae bacterium]MDW8173153.1 rhamnulokinase family protein [Anaerolineae bacterium]
MRAVIAVDLGAESGRVMRVSFDGQHFSLEEVHRFRNQPIEAHDTLYWNALRLWRDIQAGIDRALALGPAESVAISTWGVDFAMLDERGQLIDNPVHYRDKRTQGMVEWVHERVDARTIFERTGIQLMSINTLYQLASLRAHNDPALRLTKRILTIPSLFTYWLSGAQVNEFTHSTTTQCYNPRRQNWDDETLEAVGIDPSLFAEVVPPGTHLGAYRGLTVFATASHDTASAVVAVPLTNPNSAYLSSGTWSLIGLEIDQPIINDEAFAAAITNEGGAYGTYRLLQNVMGLWLAQQSRETLARAGQTYSYDDLVTMAERAEPFRSLIDPNDPRFLEPGDMPARIRDACRETGQPMPEDAGQIIRTIYESLAFKYRAVLDKLIALTGRQVERLHIVGGGSRNALLNQLTANAIGRQVVAGPTEGTALGNAIVQLIALGELDDVQQARAVLSQTEQTGVYEPQERQLYEAQYQRFLALTQA